MEENLKKLLERRSDVVQNIQGIQGEPSNEDGTFSAEQVEKFEKLKNELNTIDSSIKILSEQPLVLDQNQKDEIKKSGVSLNNVVSESIKLATGATAPEGMIGELHQDALKRMNSTGQSLAPSALVLTSSQMGALMNATVTTSTSSGGGGNVIPNTQGDYIEMLQEKMVLKELGATFISGLVGEIEFPAETQVVEALYEGEISEMSESEAKWDTIKFSPKRLTASLSYSNKWLVQTPQAFTAYLRAQIINAVSKAIQRGAINGSGTNAPLGILNHPGVAVLFAGAAAEETTNANGEYIGYEDLLALEEALASANASDSDLAFLTNAKIRKSLKKQKMDEGSGAFVWEPLINDSLMGYKAGVTNSVPKDLVKGTSEDLSALIFGDFNNLLIGDWGLVEIVTDPFTLKKKGVIEMAVNHFVDSVVLRPEAFAAIKDAKND